MHTDSNRMCVSVCVLVTRGPGGDISAPKGTLLWISAGFHMRLTSRYEDKAAILLDLLGTLQQQRGQQNTQTRLVLGQTQLLRPTHTNYYRIRLHWITKHMLNHFHFASGMFTVFKSTLSKFCPRTPPHPQHFTI